MEKIMLLSTLVLSLVLGVMLAINGFAFDFCVLVVIVILLVLSFFVSLMMARPFYPGKDTGSAIVVQYMLAMLRNLIFLVVGLALVSVFRMIW